MTLDDVSGSHTSVYIGTFTGDFGNLQARDNEGPSIYHATGLSSSLASNRLSWFYNLRGPSVCDRTTTVIQDGIHTDLSIDDGGHGLLFELDGIPPSLPEYQDWRS